MRSITRKRRSELIAQTRSFIKVELRDNYAMDAAGLEQWRAGGLESVRSKAEGYAETFQSKPYESYRRIKVVSEPLTEYHRYILGWTAIAIEAAGPKMDIRWLPRRLTSDLFLPGNDCFVLDGKLAMFNVLDGEADLADIQLSDDPDLVKSCTDAFEAAWARTIRHNEFDL